MQPTLRSGGNPAFTSLRHWDLQFKADLGCITSSNTFWMHSENKQRRQLLGALVYYAYYTKFK